MVGVLWFSRHELTQEQKWSLYDYCGDEIDVTQVDKTISSAQEIVDQLRGHRLIVAVLPTALLAELMSLVPKGVEVLIPRNKRERNEQGEFKFVHDGFDVVYECVYKIRHID